MITLQNPALLVEIAEQGAELHRLRRITTGLDYLWPGDPASWSRQAPVLFPFVGRLKDDQYTYQGHVFHQTQHGFARDRRFTVVAQGPDWVELTLQDDAASHQVYPFAFQLTVTYRLVGAELAIAYTVTNPAPTTTLLYALGAHPGFRVPLTPAGRFESTQLMVAPAKTYPTIPLVGAFNDLGHPRALELAQPLTLSHALFAQDALILDLHGARLALTLTEPASGHGVTVKTDGANYVGVWSPYPTQADLVCIEPWWGIADSIDSDGQLVHKPDVHRLAPHSQDHYGYRIHPF